MKNLALTLALGLSLPALAFAHSGARVTVACDTQGEDRLELFQMPLDRPAATHALSLNLTNRDGEVHATTVDSVRDLGNGFLEMQFSGDSGFAAVGTITQTLLVSKSLLKAGGTGVIRAEGQIVAQEAQTENAILGTTSLSANCHAELDSRL